MSDHDFPYPRQPDGSTFEQCVECGTVFGAEDRKASRIGAGVHYTHGPVYTPDGTEYDCVTASPPGSYLLHEDCYKEWKTEQRREANTQLTAFSGGSE